MSNALKILFLLFTLSGISACSIVDLFYTSQEDKRIFEEKRRIAAEQKAAKETYIKQVKEQVKQASIGKSFWAAFDALAVEKNYDNGLVTYSIYYTVLRELQQEFGVMRTDIYLINRGMKDLDAKNIAVKGWARHILGTYRPFHGYLKGDYPKYIDVLNKKFPKYMKYFDTNSLFYSNGTDIFYASSDMKEKSKNELGDVLYTLTVLQSKADSNKLDIEFKKLFNDWFREIGSRQRKWILENYGNPIKMGDIIEICATTMERHSGVSEYYIVACRLLGNGICDIEVSLSPFLTSIAPIRIVRTQIDATGLPIYIEYIR